MVADQELRKAFFLESEDILKRLDGELEALAMNSGNPEAIHSIFRGLHTIKGNSSFLDLNKITELSHGAETLLDHARNGKIKVDAAFILVVRRVVADLHLMIVDQQVNLEVAGLVAEIAKFIAGDRAAPTRLAAKSAVESPREKVDTGSFVRVDEARIGKILSLAHELDFLRYTFEQMPEKAESLGPAGANLSFEMDLHVSKLSRVTRTLSSLVFSVRLVPVNQVFQRFPRVVKDLAAKLGKSIQLRIENGGAELDKAIVEAIADPMTHLIRNAADHGIESAAERVSAGKKPLGTIKLNSYVNGNFVHIEIADDGRGIDGEKVLKKAVEKGLVSRERALEFTEEEKLALIFTPGFSTAEHVTDLSGRGVGMDVVKSNINRLKGRVQLESQLGVGTVVRLRFPLSMVVLFSIFMRVGNTNCAIPVDQVDESVDYRPEEILPAVPTGENEGDYYKVFALADLLWGHASAVTRPRSYHTIRLKDPRVPDCIFLVDDFQSIEEAVVQSVDSYVAALPGIQAASVRKDGSVSLVLNSESVAERALAFAPLGYVKRRAYADIMPAAAGLNP